MEVIVWIIVIIFLLVWLIEVLNNWKNSINWAKFLWILIIGGIALAVIFSFTAESILVIVGGYSVLIITALIFGAF